MDFAIIIEVDVFRLWMEKKSDRQGPSLTYQANASVVKALSNNLDKTLLFLSPKQ